MTVTKTWAWASHALSWQDRSQFQCKSWEHTALSYDYETQPPSQPACALGSTTGWCRCMRLGAVLCPINLEHERSMSTFAAAWPDRPEQLFFLPGPIPCKGSTGPGDVVCLQHALRIPHQTTQPSEDTGSSILTDSLNGLKASQQQVKQYRVSMLYKEKKITILLRWNKAEVPPALAARLSRYIICGDIHF